MKKDRNIHPSFNEEDKEIFVRGTKEYGKK